MEHGAASIRAGLFTRLLVNVTYVFVLWVVEGRDSLCGLVVGLCRHICVGETAFCVVRVLGKLWAFPHLSSAYEDGKSHSPPFLYVVPCVIIRPDPAACTPWIQPTTLTALQPSLQIAADCWNWLSAPDGSSRRQVYPPLLLQLAKVTRNL